MLKTLQFSLYIFAILSIALVSGCRTADLEEDLQPVTKSGFSGDGEVRVPDAWWTTFNSESLDSLVREALSANWELAAAFQRVEEARALARREASSLWPTLNAEAGALARRPELADGDSFDLGLSAAYEVDLFGRIRSASDAERFRALATALDYESIALTLSGDVTRAWFRLLTARLQEDLLANQVKANRQLLELLRNRFSSGQIQRVDILRQEQLLESTTSELYAVRSQIEVLQNQIAVLLGEAPRESLVIQTDGFPELPPVPDAGLPADLVQRRPDVQAAFNELRSADNELAAAVANRWPRLSISASAFTEENDTIGLFDDWIRTLAGNLVLPLIDGGERRAEAERTEAIKLQALYRYEQSVIEAFREVEDALAQERMQKQRLESIRKQAALSVETLEQLRRQYINGVVNYLDVLTAQVEEQRLRRDLLSEQLDLFEFRIALYRSLAGGLNFKNPKTD